jgi:Zn-finger nucleic acid-binding protein
MASCRYCSAPLSPNTQICRYCGVRNDIDLLGQQAFSVNETPSQRDCPECAIALQTVTLTAANLSIERCTQCYGLFFDPNELETLLERSIAAQADMDWAWLQKINTERYDPNQKIKYRPCPVCHVLMNRNAFARLSGVVVDRCHAHGVWLTGGALSHLLEWKKAGGRINQAVSPAATLRPAGISADSPTSNISPSLCDLVDILDLFR